MPGQELTTGAALRVLGLAEGAGRAEVTSAYRRLARLVHPDVSEAFDGAARFSALTVAYRRALAGLAAETGPEQLEPASSSAVRITVHVRDRAPRNDTSPIVAGPVRFEPSRRGGSGRGR